MLNIFEVFNGDAFYPYVGIVHILYASQSALIISYLYLKVNFNAKSGTKCTILFISVTRLSKVIQKYHSLYKESPHGFILRQYHSKAGTYAFAAGIF